MAIMCRVCLSEDVRMYATSKTSYAEIYEKHSGTKLISGRGIPDTVCYLCNYLLLKFHRFLCMSQKAEKYFQERHHSGIVILQENLTVVDQELHSLSMAKTQLTSIANHVQDTSSALGFFKSEDSNVSVKIESIDNEEDNIIENMDTDIPQLELHPNNMFRGFPSEVESSDDITIVENESNQVEPPTVNQNESNQVKPSTNNLAACLNKYVSVILERISIESISQHKNVDTHHYCTKCDYKCLLKSDLKKHMMVHNQSRTYSCKICSYRFRTIHHLKNHERIHKKYHGECNVCGKTYAKPLCLQRHMKLHTGQKQYECKMCVRKFNHKSTFLVHMRTHTGEKPFRCTICEKKFNDKSNCRKHMKTHNDQQLYECYLCSQTFSQKCHLREHVIVHIM